MASFGSWVVESVIHFSTNGPEVLARLQSGTNATAASMTRLSAAIDANKASLVELQAATAKLWDTTAINANTTRMAALTTQIDAQSAALRRLRMASIETTLAQNRSDAAFVTRFAGGGAIAGSALLLSIGDEAAKLQQVLATISNVTGASRSQMNALYKQLFVVGHETAMTPLETSKVFREISRQTQGTISFGQQMQMLPLAAKFAQVVGVTRGMSSTESTDTALALMHLFRVYDPKGMKPMFDTVLRMSELMPTNPSNAVRQMAYFAPLFKTLGVPDREAATMMVFASRAGMAKGKGGTALYHLLAQSAGILQLTSHAQLMRAGYLHEIGIYDSAGHNRFYHPYGVPGSHGKPYFDLFGMIQQLSAYAAEHPGQIMNIASLFGAQGGRIAALLSAPGMASLLAKTRAVMTTQESLGLTHQHRVISGTVSQEALTTWKDFQALLAAMGKITLPQASEAFKALDAVIHRSTMFLVTHKKANKGLVEFIETLTAGLFGTAMLGLSLRMMELLNIIKGAPTAVEALAGAFRGLFGLFRFFLDNPAILSVISMLSMSGDSGSLSKTQYLRDIRLQEQKNIEQHNRWAPGFAFDRSSIHGLPPITVNLTLNGSDLHPDDVRGAAHAGTSAAIEAILHPLNTLRSRSAKRSTSPTMPFPLTVHPI